MAGHQQVELQGHGGALAPPSQPFPALTVAAELQPGLGLDLLMACQA